MGTVFGNHCRSIFISTELTSVFMKHCVLAFRCPNPPGLHDGAGWLNPTPILSGGVQCILLLSQLTLELTAHAARPPSTGQSAPEGRNLASSPSRIRPRSTAQIIPTNPLHSCWALRSAWPIGSRDPAPHSLRWCGPDWPIWQTVNLLALSVQLLVWAFCCSSCLYWIFCCVYIKLISLTAYRWSHSEGPFWVIQDLVLHSIKGGGGHYTCALSLPFTASDCFRGISNRD